MSGGVFAFNNMEEAFEHMRAAEAAANANLAPEQRSVTYGSYWVAFHVEPPGHLLSIFGFVEPMESLRGDESKYYDLAKPEENEEFEATMSGIAERHERGYVFGRCFSVVEPEGELGDTHRANLWPITEEVFQAARAARWDPNSMTPEAVTELVEVQQAWAAHMRVVRSR